MLLYYSFLVISVVMFGCGFALQDLFRKQRGDNLKISMESAFIASITGIIVLFIINIINGIVLEFTWFTFIVALVSAINVIAFTFFTFKALEYINLSLYSLFSMLGGMALPFFQGIIFYGEGFTVAKGICVALICASLLCTFEKGENKKGALFCIGIFIFNGMSGVITKIFTATDLPKTSAETYNIWISLLTLAMSGIAWAILSYLEKRKNKDAVIEKPTKKLLWQSYGVMSLYGILNRVGGLLLVLALAHVDASVQYPMVTGGTIIVCTIISLLSRKKPSKKELVSVALAVISMLALFLIPV